MKILNFILLAVVSVLEISAGGVVSKKDWEYTIEQLNVVNEYKDEVQVDLKVTRIKRGLYGISGSFELLSGTFGEKATIGIDILRSAKRDTQFQPTPMKIPTQKFYDFMNGPYKKYLMESLAACSNLPIFEIWDTPLPNLKYVIKDCLLSNVDLLPTHLQPGFYKIVAALVSPSVHKIEIVIIAQITTKIG